MRRIRHKRDRQNQKETTTTTTAAAAEKLNTWYSL